MEPIKMAGKFAECVIHAPITCVETSALQQIQGFLDHPALEGAKIRIMPDVHAGAGAVIGFTATITDRVIPNLVGVDIGCGVCAMELAGKVRLEDGDLLALDHYIRGHVPSGFSVRSAPHPQFLECGNLHERVAKVCEATGQDYARVSRGMGTLGGGNHFIEVDVDERGVPWFVVHTGSRNFGLKIANWHQRRAKEIRGSMNGLEWLEGDDAALYYEHMKVAQEYAEMNRMAIIETVVTDYLGVSGTVIESVHNYVDFKAGIVRKGAISAQAGEFVVIPWNMRDGSVVGVGKGNAEWNFSAPHGAGRTMGRGEARRTLSLDAFKAAMAGVWSSCVGKGTLDESPMAYKDHAVVEAALADTVDVEHRLRPVYNFKAGAEEKE